MHTQNSAAQDQARRVGSLGGTRQADRPTRGPLYLALDFGGVLHHIFCGPPRDLCAALSKGEITLSEFADGLPRYGPAGIVFDRAYDLADCLDRLDADVRIVIATAWRFYFDLQLMTDMLPRCLGSRVVGVLDRLPESDEKNRALPGERLRAMHRWMAAYAPGQRWVAIDDNPTHWQGHDGKLFRTEVYGLYGAATIATLEHRLLEAIQRP